MQKQAHFALILSICSLISSTSCAAEPPSLDELLKLYNELGLPLPPNDAKLVRYIAGVSGLVNGRVQPITHGIAFQVKPGIKNEHATILVGTMQWQPSWNPRTIELKPEPAALKDIEVNYFAAPLMAIQCHARKWDQLAQELISRYSKLPNAPSPQSMLIDSAWAYWVQQITEPKTDRGPVAGRLKSLMQRDKKLDTEENQALLKALDLALVPSKAKPGSIDALIDDLVNYESHASSLWAEAPEDRYWRIAKLGFDAVPALIEHLDDARLTRAIMQGFNNFPTWNLRVGHVVADLLQNLAGEDLERDWLDRQKGGAVAKEIARKWWDKARKEGEEAYLLKRVVPPEGQEGEINGHMLNVLRAKYPRHIPVLYRTVVEKQPKLDSSMLAHAVVKSSLPANEKLKLFLPVVNHKNPAHRYYSLSAIREIDQKQFSKLLIEAIESLPKDIDGEYWTCPEADLAQLAVDSNDLAVWKVLERVAKLASVGLRMQLIYHHIDKGYNRGAILRFLASFLDDDAVRDTRSSDRFNGPCAGFLYSKIEVRNFAALQLAHLFDIEIELKPDRKSDEWAKIREQMREAVKRELQKPSPPLEKK